MSSQGSLEDEKTGVRCSTIFGIFVPLCCCVCTIIAGIYYEEDWIVLCSNVAVIVLMLIVVVLCAPFICRHPRKRLQTDLISFILFALFAVGTCGVYFVNLFVRWKKGNLAAATALSDIAESIFSTLFWVMLLTHGAKLAKLRSKFIVCTTLLSLLELNIGFMFIDLKHTIGEEHSSSGEGILLMDCGAWNDVITAIYFAFRMQIIGVIITIIVPILRGDTKIHPHLQQNCASNNSARRVWSSTVGFSVALILCIFYILCHKVQPKGVASILIVVEILALLALFGTNLAIERSGTFHLPFAEVLILSVFAALKWIGHIFGWQVLSETNGTLIASFVLNLVENLIQIILLTRLCGVKILQMNDKALGWLSMGFLITMNFENEALYEWHNEGTDHFLASLIAAGLFDFRLHTAIMWLRIFLVTHYFECGDNIVRGGKWVRINGNYCTFQQTAQSDPTLPTVPPGRSNA